MIIFILKKKHVPPPLEFFLYRDFLKKLLNIQVFFQDDPEKFFFYKVIDLMVLKRYFLGVPPFDSWTFQ